MHTYKTDFTLEGRFLGFVLKDGYKLKFLRLATTSGELLIKLSKELRATVDPSLALGEWIQVSGCQKLDFKEGMIKLKGDRLTTTAVGATATATVGASVSPSPTAACSSSCATPCQVMTPTPTSSTKKATILICQKSDCCKKGGNQISETLKTILRDRQLMDQITIKGTGCMKRCKDGPNLVMPDKTRYSRIRPDAIEAIVDKHFQAS